MKAGRGRDASPREVLELFQFAHEASTATKLEATLRVGRSRPKLTFVTDVGAFPPPPPELLEAAAALDRLQERLGVSFPMPETISAQDLRELRRAMTLLDGGVLFGTWTDATFVVPRASAKQFAEHPSPFGHAIELDDDYVIQVAGHQLSLGKTIVRLRQAFVDVATISGDDAQLTALPGQHNGFERELVEPDTTDARAASLAGQPAGALLDRLVGKWILQRGRRVLAWSDDRDSLIESARGSTDLRGATLWQVPTHEQVSLDLIGDR